MHYDTTLLMLLYTLTIALLYSALAITLVYTLIIMLTIDAYYNVTICYDITLLLTLFDALSIAAGVWICHTMFSTLIHFYDKNIKSVDALYTFVIKV